MSNYIRETLKNFSISLLVLVFPNLVLGNPLKLSHLIENKVRSMTLEEKVGQLFIVGFPQKSITPELESFIHQYKPGSFLLFKRNFTTLEQLRELNNSLYRNSFKYSKLPPLIAIDQEGGAVSRLPIVPSPPNALALGQTQSPLLAEEMGLQVGLFLREVGINMNLAPVLDVTNPLVPSFIGVRSFGSDPDLVSSLGVAYSRGLLRARVIPTAKHFPGTGSLSGDPHFGVVQNLASLESLQNIDLKPYKAYSELGGQVAVMLSHLIYPALDASREPASFSKKITHDILRGDLKYKGLVITDDLQMQGSRQLLRPEVAALKALQAGSDIVMLTWSFADQAKAFDYVKASVQEGTLSERDLDVKLKRILTVKAFANLYRKNPSQESYLSGPVLTSKSYSALEERILDKNLKNNLAPSSLSNTVTKRKMASVISRVCVASPSKKFIDSFKNNSDLKVHSKVLKGTAQGVELVTWMKNNSCQLVVAAITGPKTASLIRTLSREEKKKIIVVNLGSPRLVPNSKGFLSVVQLYFNHADSGKKVALYLNEIIESNSGKIVSL